MKKSRSENFYRLFIFLIALIFIQCADNSARVVTVPRDITITPENAYTDLFLDSNNVESFIIQKNLDDSTAALMRNFYNSRNYQYAWFVDNGLAQQAKAFWNLHNYYINYSRDSTIYNQYLYELMNRLMNDDTTMQLSKNILEETEMMLTQHFFIYARYAYDGKINPEELQWHIPRKKIDAITLLDSLIKNKGANIDDWEPVNPQYKKVRSFLPLYYQVQKNNEWGIINLGERKSLRLGDSAQVIRQIKNNLTLTSDLFLNDSSIIFTPKLEIAVMRFQKRFGLKQDGVIGPKMIAEMNVPIEKRIEQILVNMERMRWLPARPGGNFILANIPEFKLHVFKNSAKVFDMDIVVGKEGTGTVIFTDSLKYVVFSPYWNVPRSIVKNEIVPGMEKSNNYLDNHNMEITGYSNGLPIVRQKPGGNNSLGLVKFIFPNNYNIYFHDTPAKSLFENENRAFSHGCIRLKNAEQMANYLLRNQPEWTPGKVDEAMHSGNEKWVNLKEPLPVFITYFTAWTDSEGLLNFRKDIYNHDQEIASRLFRP
ncbi:MAG TPA: L,D-transpeptidase family protein [Chitinophagaceae bacterium]